MSMKTGVKVAVLLACFCLLTGVANALDCSGLPTSFTGNEFPAGNFFSNFDNSCYTIPLGRGTGSTGYGDLNSTYFQAYFKVNPQYQLILIGEFPNARYFSTSLYDAHSAISQTILDTNITPLATTYINPYQPGATYVSGQRFAMPIDFGGTPGTEETGCMMKGFHVNANALDATQRHSGMDWNTDTGLFQAYPNYLDHVVDTPQHTNPNTAGVVLMRAYLDITALNFITNPHIIVRDVASGCAYPAAYFQDTIMNVTGDPTVGGPWLDSAQGNAHEFYESTYLPELCFGSTSPPSALAWLRRQEYVSGSSPDSSYMIANVPAGTPATLAAAKEVMRIRFRIPTTPPTPCTSGCSRSGKEEMRYLSLSFINPGGATIASLADSAFTKDSSGDVTLIVGTGATIPSWITSANGYTFLDLTKLSGYQQLNLLDLRHVIPAGRFNCAGQYVPYRTAAATPGGNIMGDFMPVIDYPAAATLPTTAAPITGSEPCDTFPTTGQAGVLPNCGVFTAPPISITGVVTQCPAPGCTDFAVQTNPPVTIIGAGFGELPLAIPLTGNTKYLRITDGTKKWSAGYSGDTCNMSLTSWATNRIQFVANVNHTGCPLAAGDQLKVEVWNPQTMTNASFQVTVSAN